MYLHFSASIVLFFCVQVSDIKTWLYNNDNINKILPSELSIILHDAGLMRIGLTGRNFFKITYGYIGSVSIEYLISRIAVEVKLPQFYITDNKYLVTFFLSLRSYSVCW